MILLSNRDQDEMLAAVERREFGGNTVVLPDAGPVIINYRQDAELDNAWYAHFQIKHFPFGAYIEIEGETYGTPTGIRIYL
jgi:hypothetical protein